MSVHIVYSYFLTFLVIPVFCVHDTSSVAIMHETLQLYLLNLRSWWVNMFMQTRKPKLLAGRI